MCSFELPLTLIPFLLVGIAASENKNKTQKIKKE
jgi:hypothetical protein